jgi:hypothetical protein
MENTSTDKEIKEEQAERKWKKKPGRGNERINEENKMEEENKHMVGEDSAVQFNDDHTESARSWFSTTQCDAK